MRVLVIGGSGFVGHAVVRALLTANHDVTVLNRGSKPVPATRQLIADRNDRDALDAALAGQQFDAVVDTDCYTGEQAEQLVASLPAGIDRAVLISSAAVYADNAQTPPDETSPIGGGSVWADYGVEKTAAERVYAQAGFASAVAFRPPYVYGPNNDLDRETWFLRRIRNGRPVLVPGSGSARYQFLHEDDLGSAISLWLTKAPQGYHAYNLAHSDLVQAKSLPHLFAQTDGRTAEVICVQDAAGDAKARDWYPFRDADCAANPAAFSNDFGWSPEKCLTDRLADICARLTGADTRETDDWSPLETTILSRTKTKKV
jgi:nucleoside-diphosphate-sugar epimerase